MGQLENKVAVITGGSNGLGRAVAARFLQEGAKVCVFDLKDDGVPIGALCVRGDVRSADDLRRLYAAVSENFGAFDILVANAGIGEQVDLGAIDEAHFDRLFGINVKGTVFTVQTLTPLIREGGSIVLMSSVAGRRGGAAMSIYAATKAAIRSFARGWTTDLRKKSVRVNAISPGPIDTPALADFLSDQPEKAASFKKAMIAKVPMNRLGVPEDVAAAACFLASDEASFITGIDLRVDGGLSSI
ncbi:glucose 1-dehydrogenase [Pandoraea fibrosis]|uniref:Glucose 1-dehydrogenase n=1 Tax=Pandoraea fibrosis TaxID=1891094 RepID=A0ABX6HWQ4_9BURK|nr:glucose 1-dehydrogenase [Pandoraea fibrosis]QHE91533.1 glucose 1-dehydrogenase [Pandoraea fibrosis]QHF14909.1 glucose 1-dehydrogenase [Pandoraea fibrosis]